MKLDLTKYLSRAWISGIAGIAGQISLILQDGTITTTELWTLVPTVLGLPALVVVRDIFYRIFPENKDGQ